MESGKFTEIITVSLTPDLHVRVNEYDEPAPARGATNDRPRTPRKSVIFAVEWEKLIGNEYFDAMRRRLWKEAKQEIITLDNDNIWAMHVLFRSLHETLDEISLSSISMANVWHLVMACDKYHIDRKTLGNWFASWYAQESTSHTKKYGSYQFYTQVMYPCFVFNYALGFQIATRGLAYSGNGHITEHNPTEIMQIHLPPRIMQQLNAARGRLRNILHQGLFDHVSKMLTYAGCDCKETTVFRYLKELKRIKVWPLETTMKYANINDLIARLDQFNASRIRPRDDADQVSTSCHWCDHDWKAKVLNAATRVNDYFDGLCLDCMNVTKNLHEGHDPDNEYWQAATREQYDDHCRITHGEPTWYFSFMGRREKRGLVGD